MVAIVQTITLILAAASGLEMVMAAPIQNENVEAAFKFRPPKRPTAPSKPQGPTKVLNPTKPTNSLPVLHSSVARPPTTQSRPPTTQSRPPTTQSRPPTTQSRPPTTQSRHSTTQAGPRVSATQTQKGSSTSTPTHSPSTGANFGITCDKFSQAVVAGGKAVGAAYPAPSAAQCQAFLGGFKAGEISSAREAAMFLTNMAWESDGLRAKEEKRYTIYKAILPIFAPGEAPKEAGCYN
ncbi:hypothetical protein GQ54DRAFT_303012 [Martensiomyces pterosporus]|nr:hypothetical protein GQ54DRAFT_303012 [Martensiomyces pterosporus]